MGYIGNRPADSYTSFAVQHFTTSATTTYTLDNPVANENEIALFINNVRQEPGSSYAYTASGTTLTLSAATSASDTMYCVFIGKAVQTVTPANGSVTNDMLAGSIANAKLANSSISIDGNSVSLGGSVTGIGGANSPYFYGVKASSQTLSRATSTVITGFTTNELDSDSAFDGQTFTVPSGKGGLYYFHSNIFGSFGSVGNDGEEAQLNFRKNNSQISRPEAKHLIANTYNIMRISLSFSIIQDLSAGDTMEVMFALKDGNASSTTDHLVTNQSHFMGFKLI